MLRSTILKETAPTKYVHSGGRNGASLKKAESRKKLFENRWLRLSIVPALAILGAFSFLRYLGWSFAYSSVLGLRSQAAQAQTAHERAWIFFCSFLVIESALVVLIASYWEPPDFRSVILRFASRYGLAGVVALVLTSALVALDLVLLPS